MADIPEGAKVPDDHRPKAADVDEAEREADQVLATLPDFVPRPHQLRAAPRAEILDRVFDIREHRAALDTPTDEYEKYPLDTLILRARERGIPWEPVDAIPADASLEDLQGAAELANLDTAGTKKVLAERIAEHNHRVQIIEALRDADAEVHGETTIEDFKAIMHIASGLDEWIEKVLLAKHTDEQRAVYAEWAQGKDWTTFLSLVFSYGGFSGESQRSTS